MKKLLWFVAVMLMLLPTSPVAAETVLPPPSLVFREVKLKGEDFIVLQAMTDGVRLSEYWLGYSSSAALGTLNPEYQLAEATLQTGQAVLLANDEAVPTCDVVYAMDMPLDLAETKGTVALWHRDAAETTADIHYTRIDSFSWTTAKTGTADIVRPTAVEDGLVVPVWFRQLDTGVMTWQVGDLALDEDGACVLFTAAGTVMYQNPINTEPPVVIEGEANVQDTASEIGEPIILNAGLLAPQITEILPNPSGTGTDATDEYIELYNPNVEAFDLSGYVLKVGLTTIHAYTFPAGNVIGGQSFTVYYASETGLTMSNSGGRAALFGPDGTELAATDPYGTAGDGKAWALAEGAWHWTTSPTPGAVNIIAVPAATKTASAVKKATTTKKATTKKTTTAKTAAAKTAKAKTTKAAAKTTASTSPERATRGIHPLVLALVALSAVGYGLYEYRHDLANAFYKYRANRAARRSHRG